MNGHLLNTPDYQCNCCNEIVNKAPVIDSFAHIMELLSKGLFSGKDYKLSPEVYRETANHLTDAAVKGWSKVRSVGIDYNKPDYGYLTMLEANIHRFSAAKSVAMVSEMNQLLKKSPGDFQAFKKAVDGLNIKYNQNYLNTEYNFAEATGQAGSKWMQIQEEKHIFPYVRYRTIGDSNVREAHAKLNGKIFKVGSPELDIVSPPNGWNCRCELEQITEAEAMDHKADVTNHNDTLAILRDSPGPKSGESEYDYMKRQRFNVNRGKLQTVFLENQMYVRGFKETALNVGDWGLTKYQDITQSSLPEINPIQRVKEKALTWFASRVAGSNALGTNSAIFKDFRSFPLVLTERSFKATLGASTQFIDYIENIVTNPDEVWLVQDGKSFLYRYVKFYKGNPLMVETEIASGDKQEIVWFGKIGERYVDENWRNGVLLHTR